MMNQLHRQKIVYQFLSIALGGNSFLHPYIEDIYSKNEWEYYEAYQQSGLNGSPLFSMYTTKSEEKIRHAAGILEWCNLNQQFFPLDQLVKKGYKFAYQYFQQHAEIDFDHFMRSFAKKQKKNKVIKEIDLIYQNIVLWYLSERESKPMNKKNIAWESFQEVVHSSLNEIQLQRELFSENRIEQHREEIDLLYKEYNIPKNHHFDSLGFFIEYLISDNAKRIFEANPHFPPGKAEQLVFQRSPAKFIGALGGWLKALKVHELDATEHVPFSKSDLDRVFLEVLYVKKYNFINKEEQDLFFISCLYLQCIGSHFHQTKELYLDHSKQDYYLEMRGKEIQLQAQEADLIRSQQEWHFTKKRQQKEIEGLQQELREANAKIRMLEAKLEDMQDYSNEVHTLRNFVFLEQKEEYGYDHSPSLMDMMEFIQTQRIVVFGGFPTWRQKLKQLLKNVEFVDANELNRDISKIQRADAVFINTKVFGHAFYRKIMKELNTSEIPLYYLNGQSNMEKTIFEIYRCLTEKIISGVN